MSGWSKDELQKLGEAEEMRVSPLMEDGVTHRFPATIWNVVVDGALYARAGNGPDAVWYKTALHTGVGRIEGGGVTREVSFEPVDGPINLQIDRAYSEKYRGSDFLAPMLSEDARSATVKITPR